MSEENGFKVINVDNSKLERARKVGSLDTGAIMVLESLALYCEDLIAAYDSSKDVEYRKLFDSLQCVIQSALDNEKIRTAIMTGLIQKTSEQKQIQQKTVVTERSTRELEEAEVREYAKTHNLAEISKWFEIPSSKMRNYLNVHKIDYVKRASVCQSKEQKVRQLAKDMTIKQLACFFKCDYGTMYKYLKTKGIKCKK